MRSSRILVVIGMAVVLSVGSAFTAPRVLAETPLPIKIGYNSNSATDWLLFTARNLKFFEKVGLAPEFFPFDAGPKMIGAALDKTIDVSIAGIVAFLMGLAQGTDWTMIGIYSEGAYTEGLVAGKDSGIQTPLDLKGKRIGVYKGTTAHYGLMMILRQHGIPIDQVAVIDGLPDELLDAITKKEIDGAVVWEPYVQQMREQANARLIVTEGDLGIYAKVEGISVRPDWLRDNRETAVRFLLALLMAYDVQVKDPSIAIQALADQMGIRVAWAEEIYRNTPPPPMYLWPDRQYRYSLVRGSALHRRMGYMNKFLFEHQLLPYQVDLTRALDPSVITEALRRKNGKK